MCRVGGIAAVHHTGGAQHARTGECPAVHVRPQEQSLGETLHTNCCCTEGLYWPWETAVRQFLIVFLERFFPIWAEKGVHMEPVRHASKNV